MKSETPDLEGSKEFGNGAAIGLGDEGGATRRHLGWRKVGDLIIVRMRRSTVMNVTTYSWCSFIWNTVLVFCLARSHWKAVMSTHLEMRCEI